MVECDREGEIASVKIVFFFLGTDEREPMLTRVRVL